MRIAAAKRRLEEEQFRIQQIEETKLRQNREAEEKMSRVKSASQNLICLAETRLALLDNELTQLKYSSLDSDLIAERVTEVANERCILLTEPIRLRQILQEIG